MCGIAGFIAKGVNQKLIDVFAETISHRGPDDMGYYQDNQVSILNTRLSIIDIADGQQPFASDDGEIQVIQNGEIYNFIEIKVDLQSKGYHFLTNSDTEVILKAYECYGNDCFTLFNGMFAIAIYDRRKEKLILGRDRLGVKPLYLYQKDDVLLFSSEIKTFLQYPEFDKLISNQSIHNYLKFNYFPLPNTIFKYVKHVRPGYFYEIDIHTLEEKQSQYWRIENQSEQTLPEETVFEKLDELMNDAIRIRLRSDVEIGAFLSGGLDSSLVCAMVRKNFNKRLETFSIGFKEKKFDESAYAKQVADLNGLKSNITFLDSNIVDLWPKTTWFNDQPHGDVSFIPTYLLSEFAAKKYKLVFTGDGGDEAFAGYEKYYNVFNHSLSECFDQISLIKDDEEFNKIYADNFKRTINYAEPKDIFFSILDEVSKKDKINQILYFDT
ncbi:MAG: asparagine synthase (glutamine-hydrolyzing), partial [Ostreibacterium sp.]